MAISIDLTVVNDSAYSAFTIGLIDIIKHEHHKYGESTTFDKCYSLSRAPVFKTLNSDILNFNFKNPDKEIVKNIATALKNLVYASKKKAITEDLDHILLTDLYANHEEHKPSVFDSGIQYSPKAKSPEDNFVIEELHLGQPHNDYFETPSQLYNPDDLEDDYPLNYKNLYQNPISILNTSYNSMEQAPDQFQSSAGSSSKSYLDEHIKRSYGYKLVLNTFWMLFNRQVTEYLSLGEWINKNLIERINRILQWLKDQDEIIKKNNRFQQDPYYFEKELTQYIDLQIFNTYVNQTSYESVKHNRKEKLTINEDFLNKLIQPTTIEEDLLYLSNDLIGVHLTIRSLKKEIKSAPVVSTPHITLYKTASNYWKAELDTNNRKISKFDRFFKDSVVSKSEIKSIFSAYKNKTFSFFVNHHVEKAKLILSMCEQPDSQLPIKHIIDLLESYLRDKSIQWTSNSHFKEAAYFVRKRFYYFNGQKGDLAQPSPLDITSSILSDDSLIEEENADPDYASFYAKIT